MAMQILAKNNYDPTQLEYESAGSVTPVIQARARRGMISYLDRTEQKRVQPLLGDYQNEQKAFAILLTGYCHHHQLLNRIFGRLDDYTELLLPDNILAESGFIHLLNSTDAITDEDYQQVELIGWLYQFYISEKKDQVFASFKKNKKAEAEDIPAATQIFTPNWIVKYMVQNTVGRIWLDHKPTSPLRQKMKYLVESPNLPDPLDPPLSPQMGGGILPPLEGLEGGLKLLDPACGSGHILVEGFFHLYDIYEEEYYMPAEAVENILKYNLFGLDIDLRAAQLAQFAVLLAAATKYPDILKKEIIPHIYAMPEPNAFSREEILDFLGSGGIQLEKVLTNVLELMQQAKNLGSVMKFNVHPTERQFFMQRLETLQAEAKISLVEQSRLNKILPFLYTFFVLTDHYKAIAANPPYMGQKNMNNGLKEYVNKIYPLSSTDLFAVFMEVCLNMQELNGKMSMINQHAWMFLSSFDKLRNYLLNNFWIENMLHLGPRTFEELNGEVVQSTAFTLSKPEKYKGQQFRGNYCRLVDQKSIGEKETEFLNSENYFNNIIQSNFFKIPGCPIGYWASRRVIEIFEKEKKVGAEFNSSNGVQTGNNDKYVRLWYEIDKRKDHKWKPYIKGGSYRKWYGNNNWVLNWENNGEEIRNEKNSCTRGEEFYFLECASWSDITSGNLGARYYPLGNLFDASGPACFPKNNISVFSILGLLNTKFSNDIAKLLNPTLHFQSGNFRNIPYIPKIAHDVTFINLSSKNTELSRNDWDFLEISWDFIQFPLINEQLNLESAYIEWNKKATNDFYHMHANEEEINRIFVDNYKLNDELNPVVPLKDITILQDELDRIALGETDKELHKHRQWKMEDGKWKLYVDDKLQHIPGRRRTSFANRNAVTPH